MQIQTTHYFDASHQLPDSPNLYTKKCAQLHGHTYKLKVTIKGKNDRNGMVIDFGEVKNAVDILDHKHINDVFKKHNYQVEATAENIAKFLRDHIKQSLNVKVVEVAICEGFKGDENSNWVVIK